MNPSASTPIKSSRLAPMVRPIQAFLAAETAGGMLLMIAAVVALIWANSPWSEQYKDLLHSKLSLGPLKLSVEHWINDGLMVIFFLMVGLEIKRELLLGELATVKKAALPIAAAIGGMVVPALIYASLNAGGEGDHGWGVPMATDIAFAAGVLTLAGRNVPFSVKVFLLAIAIVDDLGAVLVIAIVYTGELHTTALAVMGSLLLLLILLNVLRVHHPWPYIVIGIGLWLATLHSGLHATIAGVMIAFTIPASRQIEELPYLQAMRQLLDRFGAEANVQPDKITEEQSHILTAMGTLSDAVQTPLARVEHALLKPVNFLIVPIFALANAGVEIAGEADARHSPITWGVLLGLFVGKPVGVLAASWVAIKLGWAKLPTGATLTHLIGVAVLCGIGFTMSLFVTNLAFAGHENQITASKIGVLAASIAAGVIGSAIILISSRSSGRKTAA